MDRFPTEYSTARRDYLQAARAAGATIESIENPHEGPDGTGLFTDVALFGPADSRVVIALGSGTHGVEGFAGSGIQTRLLMNGIASRLPQGVRMVMIHAINPYGMAYWRRFNEDNVDLNRNFRDHSEAYPSNPEYERLADAIAPTSLSFWSEVLSWGKLLWFRATAGNAAAQAAIQGGQYSHPRGLFYGGNAATWSNTTIRSLAERHLRNAERLVLVDFHTGLGDYGEGELILNVPVTSPEYQRAKTIWGDARVRSTVGGESVSARVDASLKQAFTDLLPHAEMTAVSLEFGTVPIIEVFKALRAENWLLHYGGDNHPRALVIKANLLRAFHPADAAWEERVWSIGEEVVSRAMQWTESVLKP